MIALLLLACGTPPGAKDTEDSPAPTSIGCLDVDGDGFGDPAECVEGEDLPEWYVAEGTDCDDHDPSVFPGAPEECDGVDDDCDGEIDEDPIDPGTWYVDGDGDGYGSEPLTACERPVDSVAEAGDCDDTDPAVSPEARESCNGVDDDCDGDIDEDAIDVGTWYADTDGDGIGAAAVSACAQPEGAVADSGDCDDSDDSVHPGAAESCDAVDQDCDGEVDEDAIDPATWYVDADGDGFGSTPVSGCTQPEGSVVESGDCDDAEAATHPGANEACNAVDDDCDGGVDEDVVDPGTWYVDADADGFGGAAVWACTQPSGTTTEPGDCDDGNTATHPGATESCNAVDDDCDGDVDEDAVDPGTWYVDADADGFGGAAVSACTQPGGTTTEPGDCDDGNPATHPGATESCNAADDDCDGATDEDAVDPGTWYVDVDGDGFGAASVSACTQPAGTTADPGDCDDSTSAVHPGAAESCNSADDDCDGAIDEDAADPRPWFTDLDGDGYGAELVYACDQPLDASETGGDCDDADPDVHPDAVERCDLVDEDCDGSIDEDAIDPDTWYTDGDADGYGASSVLACAQPVGTVLISGDCDDGDASVYPTAAEHCDTRDEDCDGVVDEDAIDPTTWYTDSDGDGFGATAVDACTRPADGVAVPGDCDDGAAEVNPDADERCNAIDDDCNGLVGDDPIDPVTLFVDGDGDGYGVEAASVCAGTAGYASVEGDCEDEDATVNPGMADVCYDGIDQDCDGADSIRCGPDGDVTLGEGDTRVLGRTGDHWMGTRFQSLDDLDGDGVREIIVRSSSTDTSPITSPVRGAVSSLGDAWAEVDLGDASPPLYGGTAGDFTGDGTMDLFLATTEVADTAVALLFEGPVSAEIVRPDAIGTIDGDGWVGSADGVLPLVGSGSGDTVALVSVTPFYDSAYGWSDDLGVAHILEGPFTGTVYVGDAIARIRPHAVDEGVKFGFATCAEDLDGDGVTDLAGGAPDRPVDAPEPLQGGAVYTVLGPFSGEYVLDGVPGHIVDADAMWAYARKDARAGSSMSCGDPDGDGYTDILIGTSPYMMAGPGSAWLVPGSTLGEHHLSEATWQIEGRTEVDFMGDGVEGSTDLDADGRDEVAVVDVDADGDGDVTLLFYGGSLTGTGTAAAADATFTGDNVGDCLCYVEPGGDVDGDGFEDLLLGAPGLDEAGEDVGGIFVVYGGG